MGEVSTIGLDLAKTVFQAHGADASGTVVFRKKRRDQLLGFFSSQPRCVVAMEACASAHYWAREIAALGHETKLIPPAYVKPFVKRQKNDMPMPRRSVKRRSGPRCGLLGPRAPRPRAPPWSSAREISWSARHPADQCAARSSWRVRLCRAAGRKSRDEADRAGGRSVIRSAG